MLALLLVCSFANADWDAGVAAYEAKDYKTALKEFKVLANDGGSGAQYALGVLHERGQGVIQDYKQAVKWYTLSAEQGNNGAQYNLALKYSKGEGVIQDYVMAHMFANIAASNSHSPKFRDHLAKKMTPSQLEQAQQKAREWIEKHGN